MDTNNLMESLTKRVDLLTSENRSLKHTIVQAESILTDLLSAVNTLRRSDAVRRATGFATHVLDIPNHKINDDMEELL